MVTPYGHEVVSTFSDDGVSGAASPDERPGLADAILEVEGGRAEGLIVHWIDRLARERAGDGACPAVGCRRRVQVIEAVEGEVKRDDPEDPHRRFLRQVLGAAAELERGLVRARLARGRRRKRERGGYSGGPTVPYGWRVVGEGPDAVIESDPDTAPTVRRIAKHRADGLGLQKIADLINADGVPAPSGDPKACWHLTSVRRVLRSVKERGTP